MTPFHGPEPVLARVRDQFLLDPAIAFVNHGSFGAVPKTVLADANAWRERVEREPVRFFTDEWPPLVRSVAARLGTLIGSDGADIAWVDNATTGVNAVVGSLELKPGETIVTTSHVYGAVHQTLKHHAARAGGQVVLASVPFPVASPSDVIDAVAAAIDDRTRLVVIDHVTSFSGLVFPARAVTVMCHDRGIPVLVDGAHAPGMIPLDLRALDADWYVGNCHKWLFAPKGCAFLRARPDRQARLHPTVISHAYGAGFVEEFDWTGTRDPSPWLALTAALEFIESIGLHRIQTHNNALVNAAAGHLAVRWDAPIPSPASMRASLVTLPIRPDLPAEPAVARAIHDGLLADHRVEVPIWAQDERLWLRISAQIYNSPDDYGRLAKALPRIRV